MPGHEAALSSQIKDVHFRDLLFASSLDEALVYLPCSLGEVWLGVTWFQCYIHKCFCDGRFVAHDRRRVAPVASNVELRGTVPATSTPSILTATAEVPS